MDSRHDSKVFATYLLGLCALLRCPLIYGIGRRSRHHYIMDLMSGAITFSLACVLMCVMCTGMLIAIAAGIAYGYNYSMAEFLTFTRQDVTVYMRRGQFYDKPDFDVDRDLRRSNTDGVDMFNSGNKTLDYQDLNTRSDAQALPSAWKQVKDTRTYAEVLTKYAGKTAVEEKSQQSLPESEEAETTEALHMPPATAVVVMSRTTKTEALRMPLVTEVVVMTRSTQGLSQYPTSNRPPTEPTIELHDTSPLPTNGLLESETIEALRTTLLNSESSQIVMREFAPFRQKTSIQTTTMKIDNVMYQDADYYPMILKNKDRGKKIAKNKIPPEPDIKTDGVVDTPRIRPFVPIREWATTVRPEAVYYPEEINEDNAVYKPM